MSIDALEAKAKWARQQTLELCARVDEGRLASSLSAIEIYVALYYGFLKPQDRFVLSKGHALPGLYPILVDRGFVPQKDVDALCTPGGRLGPYGDDVPGVEAQWGSVGHGLGVAAGMAIAGRMKGSQNRVVALLGDGECYEGSTWEAAMFAAHHRLSNLIAIVDRNGGITIDLTEHALELEPFSAKWRAFGWETYTVDGHSIRELLDALSLATLPRPQRPKPAVIIAQTTKGRGIKQLEGNPMGHVITPRGEDLETARRELA